MADHVLGSVDVYAASGDRQIEVGGGDARAAEEFGDTDHRDAGLFLVYGELGHRRADTQVLAIRTREVVGRLLALNMEGEPADADRDRRASQRICNISSSVAASNR